MPSRLPWHRFKPKAPEAPKAEKKLSPPPTLGGKDLTAISKKLGPAAYGTITKARAGFGPDLGLAPEQLAQVDRYLEGSSIRGGDTVEKALGLAKAGGYEAAKGLAQAVPGGKSLWNQTIGRFSDFAMDDTTSPASLGNFTAYAHGVLGAPPEDDVQMAQAAAAPPILRGYLRR